MKIIEPIPEEAMQARPAEKYNLSTVSWVRPEVSSQEGMHPS